MQKNREMRHAQRKRVNLEFAWPTTPFHLVLVEPSIPPNTGNIARLCAATGSTLHLVEPLGFELSEKQLRRAGLDYWDAVKIHIHPDLSTYLKEYHTARKILFSTSGKQSHYQIQYAPGDHLVFGNETVGLPDSLIAQHQADLIANIPIQLDLVRSLNLSNSASIALYEALRQQNPISK
jgi:tRNA (cytidine/uridine-2'-O-)-methyltransferase